MEKSGFKAAWCQGDRITKCSFLLMGSSNFLRGQYIKGFIFLSVQIIYIGIMLTNGFSMLAKLPSLGEAIQQEVWNEAKGIYEYTAGDQSLLILLFGIGILFLTIAFFMVYRTNVKSACHVQYLKEKGLALPTFKQDIKELFDSRLHVLLLSAPVTGILVFTILPLIFMITMAFTNYSKIDQHLILFDWVGLKNFAEVLDVSGDIGRQFWGVLGWTLTWAIFATILNYTP